MTHVGQEFALGTIRRFSGLFRPPQTLLGELHFRYVLNDDNVSALGTVLLLESARNRAHPDD